MFKIGVSSEYFYQRNSDGKGFNILISMMFKEQTDIEGLRLAATKATRLYPELCFRPAIRDGKVIPVPNDKEVCFFEAADRGRCYGTAETGGYLFYFTYSERELVLHMFHGTTDVKGALAYLRTMFYYYYEPQDVAADDPFFSSCRTDISELSALDDEDMYDPYRKYADMSLEPPVMTTERAFQIPEDIPESFSDCVHGYHITFKASDYLKKTKEYGASFATLVHLIVCDASDSAYDMRDETFIGMLPADMRGYFGSETLVNCSDSIMLSQTADDRKKEISTRCHAIKSQMKSRLNKEYFSALMAAKVRNVESFSPPVPGAEDAKTPSRIATPFTIGVSVSGRTEIGGGMDEKLENIYVTGTSRVPIVSMASHGDIATVCIMMKNDNPDLPYAVSDAFKFHDINCEFTDDGRIYMDQIYLDRLDRLS